MSALMWMIGLTEHLSGENRALEFALHECDGAAEGLGDVVIRFHKRVIANQRVFESAQSAN